MEAAEVVIRIISWLVLFLAVVEVFLRFRVVVVPRLATVL